MFALLMGIKTGPDDNKMNQEVQSKSQNTVYVENNRWHSMT